MLKLRVVQPGKEAVVHEFADDQAVVGRAPDCDVQVAESYVSKRHAKVLAGVVVVDLGSSNGTHVAGERLGEPVILAGRSFKLGTEDGDVRIEVEHVGAPPADAAEVLRVREDLDAERRRSAELRRELAGLRAAAPAAAPDPGTAKLVAELKRELGDAHSRIRALKSEVEERDVAASEGVQVRLAQQALADLQKTNDELRRQVDALQGRAAGPAVEAARQALATRVAELEGDRAGLEARVVELEGELRAAKAAEQPMSKVSDLFFKLQAENRELRQQLEQRGSAAAGGAGEPGSPALFFELQATNAQLRKRVEELEAGAPASAPVAGADAGQLEALRKENHDLRMSKADLVAELDLLRERAAARAPGAPAVAPAGAGATGPIRALVDDDVDGHPPLVDGPHDAFVVLELLRFLRQTERLVTRMAGDFIQLYDQRTILPDVSGNLRRLLGAVVQAPDDTRPRHDLIAYFDELRKWLVVALGANRRAAERFAEELRSDLSERSLTAARPIPTIKKLTGGVDAELWERASTYLKGLTADVVDEKLQHLSRVCAEELRREQDRS